MALITMFGIVLSVSAPAQASVGIATAPDGNFYAWLDPYRGGTMCRWDWHADNWGVCRNQASSVENRGYIDTYDDVNIYWDVSAKGAWACLGRGDYWLDLPICREIFNNGSPGHNECVNDNASSHRWVNTC